MAPGLFFILACCAQSDRHALARADDRADHTRLYTWVVEHDPSAIVAWHVSLARLQKLVPDAHIEAAREPNPCLQTRRARAALVVIANERDAARERDLALDCGVALYRDDGGLVVAPR